MKASTVPDRIIAVLDHLGIRRTHFAAQMPADVAGLVEAHGDRVGRIVLLAPPRVDPTAFAERGHDVLYIAPQSGTLAGTAARILPRLPGAATRELDGYGAESWSDIARERPDIADLLTEHFAAQELEVQTGIETEGEIAEIRYRAIGNGPPLVLTPLAFAASQWDPVIDELARKFRVIVLSGPHLGMLALLEQRAALADWQHMCIGMFQALAVSAGDKVLDVGCGSGAISKLFVGETERLNPLTAIDVSPYFLREARISIESAGLDGSIELVQASAEALPFPDDAFDAAYSITVLEECDAQKAISEIRRVVRPGGRVGIVVRGIDLPQWWNMPLADDIKAKIALPAPSVGEGGVASGALYDLAAVNGLKHLRQYTFSVASESEHGPVLEFPEAYALAQLNGDEQQAYHTAKADALACGTFFMTRCHHCFVGEVTG